MISDPRGEGHKSRQPGASRAGSHTWRRVPPVVATINNPYQATETYNAICDNCGRKAWLHWPKQKYGHQLHESNRREANKVHN